MGNAGYGNHTQDAADSERSGPEDGRMTSPERHSGKTAGTADRTPPAGPHAKPSLTNPDATPGAGTLTPPGEHDDGDSTSG
jgi:hypothetical protein